MDIRSSLDGLKSIFGATPTAPSAPQTRPGAAAGSAGLTSDLATFSNAGAQVAQAGAGDDVRWDKVASIQSQIAAGTYNVPASAVAGKVIASLLS
jgi:flagellar biosynthesis anti-sigma factor FlgM